jgi:hypothetical protein
MWPPEKRKQPSAQKREERCLSQQSGQSGVSRMKFSGFLPFPGAFLNFCKNYVAETLLERKKNRRICLRTLWKRSNRCFHVRTIKFENVQVQESVEKR